MLFTGNGQNVLCDDGVFRSSAIIPGPITYTGSLAGVNAKLLLVTYTNNLNVSPVNRLNSVITALGGTLGSYSGATGIYIKYIEIPNGVSLSTALGTGTGGYDSNYDAVLAWTSNS